MKLASIFTDRMVLQKGLPIRVFGEGNGTVTVDFLGNFVTDTFEAISDAKRIWSVDDVFAFDGAARSLANEFLEKRSNL